MAAADEDAEAATTAESLLSRLCRSSPELLDCDASPKAFADCLRLTLTALTEDDADDPELQLQLLMKVVSSDLLDGCLRKFALPLDSEGLLGCWGSVVEPALRLAQLCLDRLPSESLRLLGEPLQLLVALVRAVARLGGDNGGEQLTTAELAVGVGDSLDRLRAGQLLGQRGSAADDNDAEELYLLQSGDYRDLPLLPEAPDLLLRLGDVHNLRPNVTCGRYRTAERYLDTQFRLLREDFVESLRAAVRQVVEEPRGRRLSQGYVYRNVRLLDRPICCLDGVRHPMALDAGSAAFRRIRWDATKRLGHRSLLCCSCDNFRTVHYATVADRGQPEFLTTGVLLVQWLVQPQLEQLQDQRFLVVEPKAYYEGYRHVLQSLIELQPQTLPFAQYLVQCQNGEIQAPKYLTESGYLQYNFGPHIVNPNERHPSLESVRIQCDQEWPTAQALGLDSSQYDSLKAALRQELCLIQGPPGTGKTYIGLLITRLIMENAQKMLTNFGPILLVCYTNHALDQFLECLVSAVGPSESRQFTRVGSQCKSQKLQHLLLSKKRAQSENKWDLSNLRRDAKSKSSEIDLLYSLQLIARSHILDFSNLMKFPGLYNTGLYMHAHLPQLPRTLSRPLSFTRWVFGIEDWDPKNASGVGSADVQSTSVGILAQVLTEEIRSLFKDLPRRVPSKHLCAHLDQYRSAQSHRGLSQIDKLTIDVSIFDYTEGLVGRIARPERELRERVNLALDGLEGEAMSEDEVATSVPDVWGLDLWDRWRLYRHWRQRFLEYTELELRRLIEQHEASAQLASREQQRIDYDILRQSSLVAMTTTAAARDRETLRRLRPKVVIIEEAAELLESHVLACLTQSCEHLILIGDHKQLRPSTSVIELATKYRLDVSLFERLVTNQFQYHALSTQHRMRPEFSRLVRLIYPELRDHSSVLELPQVRGLASSLLFLNHSAPEERDEALDSWLNSYEAEMAANLTAYLIMQGYRSDQITVLTLYTGQLLRVQKLLRRCPLTEPVRACVCDNFQGEENDLVIVSLVRSNEDSSIGFLRADNRTCVALSRARLGMIVLGNLRLLSATSRLWRRVWSEVKEAAGPDCSSGDSLAVRCQQHGTLTRVASPLDFGERCPHGGCDAACSSRLPACGHQCPLRCHSVDASHEHVLCQRPCPKACPEGHPCSRLCHELCRCGVKVLRRLPDCAHEQEMECHVDVRVFVCRAPCPAVCCRGHACRAACGAEHKCCGTTGQTCRLVCPAGHECEGVCDDPLPCQAPVELERPDCGHLQELPCHEVNPRRQCDLFWWRLRACETTRQCALACGHSVEATCGQDADPICPLCGDDEAGGSDSGSGSGDYA